MEYIDFAYVLSTSLTPITLISGAGFLLMTMSGRYEHTTGRVRELLQAKDLAGYENPELDEEIELIFRRATLLKKAILLVTLSATFSGLLVLSSVVESMFNVPLEIVKSILLLISVGLIVLDFGAGSGDERTPHGQHARLNALHKKMPELFCRSPAFFVAFSFPQPRL